MSEGTALAMPEEEPQKPARGMGGRIALFKEEVQKLAPDLEHMLGSDISVGAFVEVATNAVIENPALLDCSAGSLVLAVRRSAQLKLRPDGVEGAFIPRGKKAFFEPMFQGVVRAMLRTGTVLKVEAHAVHKEDHFDYGYGLDPFMVHKPHRPQSERGMLTEVYAIVWLRNGERQFEVMDRDELIDIRDRLATHNGRLNPAYRDFEGEMYRKIAVKRLSKYIEQDAGLAAVVEYDNSLYSEDGPMDPARIDGSLEWRSVDERATENAERQSDRLRAAVEAQEDAEDAVAYVEGEPKTGGV